MLQRIIVTLDLLKIDPKRIKNKTYTDKKGNEVTKKEYQIEVIEMREEKHTEISSGPDWKLMKTHFAVNAATKEEKAQKKDMAFVGDGMQFINTSEQSNDVPW